MGMGDGFMKHMGSGRGMHHADETTTTQAN
jgi:hypothetical protein